MLDGLRGTEQEHIEHYWIPSDTECVHGPEQARDIAVVVSIETIGGNCQDLERYQNIEQMYQTTSGGLGHETRVRGAHRCEGLVTNVG